MRPLLPVLAGLLALAQPVAAQHEERPPHRVGAGFAYDQARGRLVMFGGVSYPEQEPLADTWEWDGRQWHRLAPAAAPSPRAAPGMAFDPGRGRVVLYGGIAEVEEGLDETWEWDGTAWHRLDVPGPGPRMWHHMYFDPVRRQVLLTGGVDAEDPRDDIWAWNGTTWTEVQPATAFSGPRPADRVRQRAYTAAMRSDLRNLATSQEVHFADHATYAASLEALATFEASTGVSLTILAASATGWSAVAEHAALPGARCGIYIGDAAPPFPEAAEAGLPACVGVE